MSERDIIEAIIKWRSVTQMLERDEFRKLSGDNKGLMEGQG